jgi:hypothetical protein
MAKRRKGNRGTARGGTRQASTIRENYPRELTPRLGIRPPPKAEERPSVRVIKRVEFNAGIKPTPSKVAPPAMPPTANESTKQEPDDETIDGQEID